MLATCSGVTSARRRLAGRRQIDGAGRNAERLEPVADEFELAPLRIERAGDDRGAADALGERKSRTCAACRLRAATRRPSIAAGWSPAFSSAPATEGSRPASRQASRSTRRRHCRRVRSGRHRPTALRRSRRPAALAAADRLFLLPTDAEQALLQFAIGGKRARLHHPVDAAVDHDGDVIGHAGRHADILLDHEDRHRRLRGASCTSMFSTCSTITGAKPSVGSSMISRCGLPSSARPIASICCSPPESCVPPLVRRS